jgi:hypothetical protein
LAADHLSANLSQRIVIGFTCGAVLKEFGPLRRCDDSVCGDDRYAADASLQADADAALTIWYFSVQYLATTGPLSNL